MTKPAAPDAAAETVKCKVCGLVNEAGMARCVNCGHDLEWTCRRCGRRNSKAVLRCFCGAKRSRHMGSKERRRRRLALGGFIGGGLLVGVVAGHYIGLWVAMNEVGAPAQTFSGISQFVNDVFSPVQTVVTSVVDLCVTHKHVFWSVIVSVAIALAAYAWIYPPWWLRRIRWRRRKRRKNEVAA